MLNFPLMFVPEAKVVILGAQGVGKTSFIHRYVGHIFEQHTSPTIGGSFFSCNVQIDTHELQLLIWDTAGQERFRSMAPMYYRNANAAIVMFDLTCYESYQSMKDWVKELKNQLDDPITICVVGNKSDLLTRQIGFREASEYAISIGALYHESSALNSEGVESVFLDIAQELIKQFEDSKERRNRNAAFQEGKVIRVSPTKRSSIDDSEERSFLCC